jgi:hypothetical protein
MRFLFHLLLFCVLLPAGSWAQEAATKTAALYENHFTETPLGKPPKEFLVLEGKFVVSEVEGNKVLQLPGEPLETFGVLFGPSQKEGLCVSARIQSEATRRTFPSFGVGLNGVSGPRLLVSPSKKAIEIHRGTEVKVSAKYDWKSGSWTQVRLQIMKTPEGKWRVMAKAWPDGESEPAEWVVYDDEKEPPNGRPSIWGTPYSGKRILFDDLAVTPAAE